MEIYFASGAASATLLVASLLVLLKSKHKKLALKYQALKGEIQDLVSQADIEEPPPPAKREPLPADIVGPAETPAVPDDTQLLFEQAADELVEPEAATRIKNATPPAPRRSERGLLEAGSLGIRYDLSSGEEHIPDSVRERIFERDHHACRYCRSQDRLTVRSILPTYRKGIITEVTLVTICEDCIREEKLNCLTYGGADAVQRRLREAG